MSFKNKFAGADDIYQTDKFLVRVKVWTSNGVLNEKRSYFKKTSDNIRQAKEINGYIPKKLSRGR